MYSAGGILLPWQTTCAFRTLDFVDVRTAQSYSWAGRTRHCVRRRLSAFWWVGRTGSSPALAIHDVVCLRCGLLFTDEDTANTNARSR